MWKFIIEAFITVEKLCNSKMRCSSHCQENAKPLNLVTNFCFSVPLFFFCLTFLRFLLCPKLIPKVLHFSLFSFSLNVFINLEQAVFLSLKGVTFD